MKQKIEKTHYCIISLFGTVNSQYDFLNVFPHSFALVSQLSVMVSIFFLIFSHVGIFRFGV